MTCQPSCSRRVRVPIATTRIRRCSHWVGRVLEGVLVCAEADRVPAVQAGDAEGVHLGGRGDGPSMRAPACRPGPRPTEALVRGLAAHPEDSADGVPARAGGPRRGDRLAEQAPRLGAAPGGDVDELEELVAVRFGLLGAGHPGQRRPTGPAGGRPAPPSGRGPGPWAWAHAVNARLTRIRVSTLVDGTRVPRTALSRAGVRGRRSRRHGPRRRRPTAGSPCGPAPRPAGAPGPAGQGRPAGAWSCRPPLRPAPAPTRGRSSRELPRSSSSATPLPRRSWASARLASPRVACFERTTIWA